MENRIKVVIADGNEEYRTQLSETVEASGDFQVVGLAGDGQTAVELVRQTGAELLLLELVMPGLDGLGVLKKLKEMERPPQVIAMSIFCSQQTVAMAGMLGAAYFMAKPCEEEALLERMRAVVSLTEEEQEDHAPGLESLVTSIIHEVGVPAHIKG